MATASFSQELKALREEQGVTLQTISDKTGIQLDVLQQLESGELFSNKRFHNIYIEAFVKSYAGFVGVSQGDALQGAKQTFNGLYNGLIGEQYGKGATEKQPDKSKKTKKVEQKAEEVKAESVAIEPSPVVAEPVKAAPLTFDDNIRTDINSLEHIPDDKPFAARLAEARREGGLGGSGFDGDGGNGMRILGILGGVAILIGLGYFIYSSFFASPTETTQNSTDNTANNTQTVEKPKVTLPDSFRVEIIALSTAQSGIKITNDGFTRARINAEGKTLEAPFTFKRSNLTAAAWIEKGEGIRVFTKDSLRIDGATGVQIKVNGKEWKYTPAPSIVLTRKMAEEAMK